MIGEAWAERTPDPKRALKVHYNGALRWTNAKGITTDILPGHTACSECRRYRPPSARGKGYYSTDRRQDVTCRSCLKIMRLAAQTPLEMIAHKAVKETPMPNVAEKKITRVRIEFDDGSAQELTNTEPTDTQRQMAMVAAVLTYLQGYRQGQLLGAEMIPEGAVREIVERFRSWLPDDVTLCARSFGEYRPLSLRDQVDIIHSFAADYARPRP